MSTTTQRVRGPYAKTVRVRERILDACSDVFAESGYRSTTMKEIAERAGISEGGLVHHFPSKQELLLAVLERQEQRDAQHFEGMARFDAKAGLRAVIEVVSEGRSSPGLVELHIQLSAEAISPEHPAHDHYRERNDGMRTFLCRAFDALRDDGELVSPLSTDDLAEAFLALWDGLQMHWLYERSVVDASGVMRRFLESVVPSLKQT